MSRWNNISKIALQRGCLLIFVVVYVVYALYVYNAERVIDLLTAQFVLDGNSCSVKTDQLSTYVINLDSSTDRYALIKPQLDKHKIKHRRFSAVNGYDVKITDDKQNKFYGRDIKSKKYSLIENKSYSISCPSDTITYTNNGYTFSAGEFGCYCSHREVWHDIVKHNIKYALILEDDARLSENFTSFLNTELNNTPSKWDVIYLYITPKKSFRKFISIVNNPYFEKIGRDKSHMFSFVAYMVSYDGAKKLLENSTTFSLVIDVHSARLIASSKLKAYKAVEEFVTTYPKVAENSVLFQMGRYHY